MNNRIHHVFWAILLVGLLLRAVVGSHSLGIVHPDEHQQYLEAANRVAYGQGVMFWEYERGVRHYMYPYLLASSLHVLDFVGVTQTIVQAQVIRCCLGFAVLGSLAMLAHRWLRQGRTTAAFSLLSLSCFTPYFLFIGARTLSETAAIPVLVAMIYFLDQRSVLAGLLGGLIFGIRFQMALFVAPLFFALLLFPTNKTNQSTIRSSLRFMGGVAIGLLSVGAIDYLTWGSWFHSPIAYFEANILEGVAASFGVSPWYYYFEPLYETVMGTSILLVPLAIFGAIYQPRLAFAAFGFFAAHSMVGHKEARFIWPLAPVALILISTGIDQFVKASKVSMLKSFALISMLLVFMIPAHDSSIWRFSYHFCDYEANSRAIAWVGNQLDAKGLAVHGNLVDTGNCFYLRQPIPYVVQTKWKLIEESREWRERKLNYVIAKQKPELDVELTPLASFDDWTVFRAESIGSTDSIRALDTAGTASRDDSRS